ncbi:hypothetical protein G7007_10040 [Pseudomonas entomophila]|jgi:hypothetical protein|uniref:hypothetical protein n=1 Tax=Pseudomonas entomophila TaxID=312306 RepID=UPI0015E3DE24|nr:hypothetical protein [Pseudomonas entomophila]MBA1193201.1 hypothetical protein [Pseudomonas entomophila]
MKDKPSFCPGDEFVIPMEDGRRAVAQIVWMGTDSAEREFKNIFAFIVRSVGQPSAVDNKPYMTFKEHRGEFTVISPPSRSC